MAEGADRQSKKGGPDPDAAVAPVAGGRAALGSSWRRLREDGALVAGGAALLRVNQPGGFDCPGCAWPEPGEPSRLEFCENGLKAVSFEATTKRAGPDFFAAHPLAELRLRDGRWLEAQGRLTEPLRHDPVSDTYRRATWNEAFAAIGGALDSLDQPDAAVFYTSGRTSNEAAFLYQLLARRLGTNNLPDCSNMCHESSGVGLTGTIGVGKGTVTLEDFALADLIFVIGQNPGTNHPRMLTELQAARRRGAGIVAINPLREAALVEFAHPKEARALLTGRGTPIASRYLQVLVGGDLAALQGMGKALLELADAPEAGVLDRAFLDTHTSGFDGWQAQRREQSWDEIERHSGLSRGALVDVARIYAGAERTIACWAMGLTQQPHAVATIQEIVNLLLLRGNLGRPGAGVCPVRGHSNVQGDRTVGITEKPAAAFLDALGTEFGFVPPREHGLDTVGTIGALRAGRVRFFMSMGGNFVAAAPDTTVVEQAMRQVGFTVHVATHLNRTHLAVGREAWLLPCLGRTELDLRGGRPQRVTVEDSMSMVHASQGRRPPASSSLLSEPAIVAGIGAATRRCAALPWGALGDDYALIRERIARVLPGLFADFEHRIDMPGGFYLGNAARERTWNTSGGRARFTTLVIPDLTLPEGQLRLMTLRSHDQFNTTVYADDDRYRGVSGDRRVIFLHPLDLAARGLCDGASITVVSHYADGERRVVGFRARAYDIPRGCAAGYFPELNPLVSAASFAEGSRTPTSKLVPITVHSAEVP